MDIWGLKPPESVQMWWGARAIYYGASDKYQIDLLSDRQSMTGGDEQSRKALADWINKKGLKGLRQRLKEEAVAPRDNILLTFEESDYIICANPKQSCGYLYICAFKKN